MLARRQSCNGQLCKKRSGSQFHCLGRSVAAPATRGQRLATSIRVLAAAGTKQSKPTPTTPKAAVEAGLKEFQESKDYAEAVRLFKAALELNPSSEEAAAALFNLGCAHAKMRNFKAAAEAIGTAINDHNLKLTVALKVSTWELSAQISHGSCITLSDQMHAS